MNMNKMRKKKAEETSEERKAAATEGKGWEVTGRDRPERDGWGRAAAGRVQGNDPRPRTTTDSQRT